MVVIWIVLELMFVIMFYQLPSAVEDENESEDSAHTNKTSSENEERTNKATASDSSEDSGEVYGQNVNSGSDTIQIHSPVDRKPDNDVAYTEPDTGETTPLLSAQHNTNTKYSLNRDTEKSVSVHVHDGVQVKPEFGGAKRFDCGRLARQALRYVMFMASQMVREEIVVLLAVLFMTMFSQTAIEVGIVCIHDHSNCSDTTMEHSDQGIPLVHGVS